MVDESIKPADIFNRRTAGCLCHPTSLPGLPIGECQVPSGNIGHFAHKFIHLLYDAGLTVWQMLPTGPTHEDRSPYQSWSAHAGSPSLICLPTLVQWGWLDESVLTSAVVGKKALDFDDMAALRVHARIAFYRFLHSETGESVKADFERFLHQQSHWLEDFSLFLALRKKFSGASWLDWPTEFRLREPRTLDKVRVELEPDIQQAHFEQFAFYSQWQSLRRTAHDCGVHLFGDIPIFVALDSVDVWAHPEQFMLDEQGRPLSVAGVPPDYFSETGQHWGNPHYQWNTMEADGFQWWRQRLAGQLEQFDLIRIDHFRGLDAFWEIPAGSPDARNGRWVKAPGRALLSSFFEHFHSLPIVAENLGLITSEVEKLRKSFALPGMLVLQFGFDGSPDNINAPHHFEPVNIVYTGTHDNDTTSGWLESLESETIKALADYLNTPEPDTWGLIKTALGSVARMAIIPLQDWLALDNRARMNTPGTAEGNWHWRFEWSDLAPHLAEKIRHEIQIYDRLGRDLPFADDHCKE